MLRQTQQEEDENLRHELDNELDSIRSLLFAAPPQAGPSAEGEASAPVTADLPPDGEDKEYDQYVRELALFGRWGRIERGGWCRGCGGALDC